MRLGSKVENGIDFVSLEAVHDLGRVRDITMVEAEIWLIIESAGVALALISILKGQSRALDLLQGSTVVELVKGHDVVGIGVRQS